MRKAGMVALCFIWVLGMATSAGATVLSYSTTAADSGPGAGVTYSLTFSLDASIARLYHATFQITENLADTSPEWRVGWVVFKFDGSTPSDITNLVPPGTTGTGPWSIADVDTNSTVKVLTGGGNYGTLLPTGGFSGFYVTSLAEGLPADDPTQGLILTGNAATPPTVYTFTFDFTVPAAGPGASGSANTLDIPFLVGYYDGLTGGSNPKYIVNQISQDLTSPVPEPGTLLLLGSGLIGVGAFGRRLRKRG